MKDEIFRKSSINRINSPDVLNEYIKVSSPSVWILIASIIVLLFGTLVWGYFGKIDSTIPLDFVVNNNGGTAIVELDEAKNVKVGMEVEIDNNIYTVNKVEILNNMCYVVIDCDLDYGIYSGKVILERIKPMSFVLN